MLLQDLRYGVRMLLKHKGFTAVAIVALGLGIGANTAIFSVVNSVLLRPLPYAEAERIIYFGGQNVTSGIIDSNLSLPDFQEWAKAGETFEHITAFQSGNANLAAEGTEPERVPRALVLSDFFGVLGVQPSLGRAFLPEEDQPKARSVAILSQGLWQRRFGGDPAIIGKEITINANPTTVVGIMPAGFAFPQQTQLWITLRPDPAEERRDNRSYSVIARLKPGVPLEQAQARVSAINAQLAQQFPDTNRGWDARIATLHDQMVRAARPSLLALLGAVVLVLLIACANVANLLLSRAAGRQKEVAIRTAMGASRARIVRQLLTESLLLAALGGIAGLLLSIWLTDVLQSIAPEGAPRIEQVGLDTRVLFFALGISLLTGVVFGLAPALQSSKGDVSGSLKEGGRTGEGFRRTSARSLLLIGEVALSLMLLIGAGLLIKSFLRLQEVQPGFNPQNVLVTSVALPGAKYPAAQRPEFFGRLVERLSALPGVQAVGGGVNLPLRASNYSLGRSYIPEGRPLTTDESQTANYSIINGDFFRALQIPVLAGRVFDARDNADAPKVIVVNETVAKRHFGSVQNAIGKRLTVWRDEEFLREIVGVVADTKVDSLEAPAIPQLYVPHPQDAQWNFMALVIRTAGNPAAFASAVRREVQALDRDQPVYNVRTMEEVLATSLGTRRVAVQLFTVFAAAALLLSALGIYGVMAYSVTQRTQEIGIRMALGAQTGDVLGMIVRQGMKLALVGIAVGLAAALGVTRLIANLLFGVEATDPMTFAAISLLLAVVALLACYLPARRAAKLDPMNALARST